MDDRIGQIYQTIDEVKVVGVSDEYFVIGLCEVLECLSAMIQKWGSFKNFLSQIGVYGFEQWYCGNSGCVDCV